MSRRRSTSSNHKQIEQNLCYNLQHDPNNPTTSNDNNEVHRTLVSNNHHHVNLHQNSHQLNHHPIPPPHRNNLKPVDSPLRRPRSPTEDEISEFDDFVEDPGTKLVNNNRKKTKTNYIKNNNNKQNDLCDPRDTPTSEQSHPVRQHNSNATPTALVNQQLNTNRSSTTTLPLTNEAKRFAQTRYPFSPFIIRFPSSKVQEQKVSEELCKHLKENQQFDLELIGFRKSTVKCSLNECDILLFVKNSRSFSILYDKKNWPQTLLGTTYTRPYFPSIPPQLSLIVKNVGLSMDIINFTMELKANYSCLQKVIRMKNKNQVNIKLVKLEFSKPGQREKILDRGKICVNSLTFDVDEYLAPARVLICSKCKGIGHFRKQCQQKEETCNKCGGIYQNIKEPIIECSQLRCIHCQGDHMSNDIRCPKVKQFRADLTKYLLSPAIPANPGYVNFDPTTTDFPPMNQAQRPTLFNYPFNNKFNNTNSNNSNNDNTLIFKLNEINDKLEKLSIKSNRIEVGMEEIKKSNEELKMKIVDLAMDNTLIKDKFNNHERISKDLLVPVVKHLIKFTSELNVDHGRWNNADFGSQIELYLKQWNNIKEAKELL